MRECLVLLLSAAVAAGESYHVAPQSPAASDEGPGTAEAPWKTCANAARLQPGDTLWLHEGRYAETVTIAGEASRRRPVTVAAWADDVVEFDGADPVPADRWTLVEGFTNVYATPLERDPGEVFVDGRPVYPKVERLAADDWRLVPITDADAGWWQYDAEGRRLLLNLGGGNPAAGRLVEVPVRPCAFRLGEGAILRGVRVRRYAGVGIDLVGDDAVAEDCLVSRCGHGIRVAGWDRRGALVRRNTVIECLGNGIFLQDRPTACRVEENLVVRCTLNPAHAVGWLGSVKMNSASDSLFAHNVVLEAGNPETINGWDGWALWGDINIVRVLYLGNVTAHNKEAGIYIEYAMGDTSAYYNSSWRDGHGITCRQSQRGLFLHNVIESARSSGLAVWAGGAPYPTINHVFAHNLVRDCSPALRLQIEHPNFADYNIYGPLEGRLFADGERGRRFETMEQLREETGHELHGEIRDVQPEELGLGRVTFRVPDATDPSEVLGMVGNLGAEFEDPHGVNLLPYFWRPATADGAEHTWTYAAYTDLPGGVDQFTYPGAGGTVSFPGRPELAHSGNRCLEVIGVRPERIPAEGIGYASPVLPARPGDEIEVSFWAWATDLAPVEGSALAASAEVTDATGQHRQRLQILPAGEAVTGSFEWREWRGTVTIPESARRVRFFFGLRPATGTLRLDDFAIRVR